MGDCEAAVGLDGLKDVPVEVGAGSKPKKRPSLVIMNIMRGVECLMCHVMSVPQ